MFTKRTDCCQVQFTAEQSRCAGHPQRSAFRLITAWVVTKQPGLGLGPDLTGFGRGDLGHASALLDSACHADPFAALGLFGVSKLWTVLAPDSNCENLPVWLVQVDVGRPSCNLPRVVRANHFGCRTVSGVQNSVRYRFRDLSPKGAK